MSKNWKYHHIYDYLTSLGYDYSKVTNDHWTFRVKIYKDYREHTITWQWSRDQDEEFGFMVKKHIYEIHN